MSLPAGTWDYIIVGGGSGGATLAARLSEDADRQVLLLEAGGEDRALAIQIPGMVEPLLTSRTLNWQYEGEPDPSLNGRRLTWAAGRVIGGSSSINGMVYGRGLPADYDAWEAAGNPGWGWLDMLPVFKQIETWTGPPHRTRGTAGPLQVRPFNETEAACDSALEAFIAAGVPFLPDYSVGVTEGIGRTQATQRGGWRHSAARAFLSPARRRKNLRVVTGCRVDRLLIKAGRCHGVAGVRQGQPFTYQAAGEVIVCAGAIATPKLLLLSGIGAPDALAAHGIAVVHELPGVGRGMNDHVNIKISAFVNTPTYNTARSGFGTLRHGFSLLARGAGPASSPANHCQAFVKTDPALASADVQVQLMALGFGTPAEMAQNGITAVVSPCRPAARGQVSLRSADPAAPPRISMAMLSEPADIDVLLKGCRMTMNMLRAGPGRTHGARIYAPAGADMDDAGWLEFFRATAALNWHPASTCRMGPAGDPGAVVDASLAVHGLAGLRIADASIMPCVTSANTNIPVIAIAERAARFMRAGAA